jgi:predicted ester cyclase
MMNRRRNVLTLASLVAGVPLAMGRADAAPAVAPDCARGPAEALGGALLDRYVAAVNAQDTRDFAALFADGYIQHSGRSPSGLAAQVQNMERLFASMPDVRMTVEDRVLSGDKVVARNRFDATHTRTLQGMAPTGRRFALRTIDIWRVEDGKFAEHWDIVDAAGLQKQLRGE